MRQARRLGVGARAKDFEMSKRDAHFGPAEIHDVVAPLEQKLTGHITDPKSVEEGSKVSQAHVQ